MKILSISSNYPRFLGDRNGWFVHELNKRIFSHGYEIIVMAPGYLECKNEDTLDNIKIFRYQYFYPQKLQKLTYNYGIIQNLKNSPLLFFQIPFFLIFGLTKLIRIIVNEKPDIIHAHWLIPNGFFGIFGKYLFNIPLIVTVHGTDIRSLPEKIRCFLLGSADAIISPHPELSQLIKNKCNLLFSVPNIIDETQLVANNDSLFQNNKDEKSVISFIGRLETFKDPITLIKSVPYILKKTTQIRFLIVGEGPLLDEVCKLIKQLHISDYVHILGLRSDVSSILKKTTIFVSLSPVENIWSLSLVEAMINATPCIVTDSGTTSIVLKDMHDVLFIPPHNPEALAEKILFSLENKEIHNIIAKNGQKKVKEIFNNSKNVEKIISIYQKCLFGEIDKNIKKIGKYW